MEVRERERDTSRMVVLVLTLHPFFHTNKPFLLPSLYYLSDPLSFFAFFLEFEVLIGRYISRVVTNWKVYYVRGARNTQLCPFKCAVENASSKIFNILLITL